jgi:hypothetical protein
MCPFFIEDAFKKLYETGFMKFVYWQEICIQLKEETDVPTLFLHIYEVQYKIIIWNLFVPHILPAIASSIAESTLSAVFLLYF